MVNSLKNKALVILSVLVLSIVMVFGIVVSTSSSAYANETQQCSNETIEEDANPQVRFKLSGNTHELWAESSKTQYAWFGQKFTKNTFIQAIKDADKNAPEGFWNDVADGNPIRFVIQAYKYVGSEAITQAAIDTAIDSAGFVHKAAKNNLKIAEIEVRRPMWVEPHLEDANCFCNIANVKNITVESGNFGKNAFGLGMPDLEKITSDNCWDNYSEAEVKAFVNPDVKVGCKWDAKTSNPFTYNYRYTYDGTNWNKSRF